MTRTINEIDRKYIHSSTKRSVPWQLISNSYTEMSSRWLELVRGGNHKRSSNKYVRNQLDFFNNRNKKTWIPSSCNPLCSLVVPTSKRGNIIHWKFKYEVWVPNFHIINPFSHTYTHVCWNIHQSIPFGTIVRVYPTLCSKLR